tara:strand:- start:1081 stop:1308 length:228 start_codon:yes stop_codon:yes gene_type:complete
MSTNQPPPRLPDAPEEYNIQFMQDLIRAIETFIQQERNTGELRGTKITLTNLPTSSSGLETGALFNDSGTIKVVE